MIDDSFFSVANLEGVLSKERVEETAKQTTEKLAELLSEFIAEHNAFVHQVNNTKNRPEQKDLFEALKVWRHETFNPLRYFWAKQSTPEKNDWLDQQLFRFINPEFNIEIADDETILEERNHLLVNTLSNSEEVEDQKNIHANYGQAHLSGIHDVMQYENWKLKDIELTPVKFKKISWWKRAKNFAKAPFSLAKKIPKFFRLAKLSNEAKKENKEIFKQQESQTTEHRKNLNEEISEKNKKPELKLEKTKKPEESKDESLDTAA